MEGFDKFCKGIFVVVIIVISIVCVVNITKYYNKKNNSKYNSFKNSEILSISSNDIVLIPM